MTYKSNEEVYKSFKKFLTPDVLLSFNTGEQIWQYILSSRLSDLDAIIEGLPNCEKAVSRSAYRAEIKEYLTSLKQK